MFTKSAHSIVCVHRRNITRARRVHAITYSECFTPLAGSLFPLVRHALMGWILDEGVLPVCVWLGQLGSLKCCSLHDWLRPSSVCWRFFVELWICERCSVPHHPLSLRLCNLEFCNCRILSLPWLNVVVHQAHAWEIVMISETVIQRLCFVFWVMTASGI